MSAAAIAQPGVCRICECTEFTPCIIEATGETCAWADESRTLCNFCADMQRDMRDAFDQGYDRADGDEPLVQLATEADLDELLRR
jgi:hypothetical protein